MKTEDQSDFCTSVVCHVVIWHFTLFAPAKGSKRIFSKLGENGDAEGCSTSTTKNDHAVRGIKMIIRAWPRLTALYAIQKDTTAHGVRLPVCTDTPVKLVVVDCSLVHPELYSRDA